jgi:hypothetical protein
MMPLRVTMARNKVDGRPTSSCPATAVKLAQTALNLSAMPGIHVFSALKFAKTWMAGTSPAMTE